MAKLLDKTQFRAALKEAMQGREAKDASFSVAWSSGKLQREHFARWAENHFHYVGPFADYLGYIYANAPDHATEAKDFLLQNMYEEELADIRHTDLLIRFAEACGTTRERVQDPRNMNPVTRGLPNPEAWGRWTRQIDARSSAGQTILSGVGGRPLLTLGRAGQGRVAQLWSDQVWLWSRGYDGGGPHGELLRRLAHWLMQEPELEDERLTLEPVGGRPQRRDRRNDRKIIVGRKNLEPHALIQAD